MVRRVTFYVSFDLPEGALRDDAKKYVEAAVSTWRGSLRPDPCDMGDGTFEPGDPMWGLEPDTITIR